MVSFHILMKLERQKGKVVFNETLAHIPAVLAFILKHQAVFIKQ